eukprot:15465809-Alexandrium_andersonii.AAC.1
MHGSGRVQRKGGVAVLGQQGKNDDHCSDFKLCHGTNVGANAATPKAAQLHPGAPQHSMHTIAMVFRPKRRPS